MRQHIAALLAFGTMCGAFCATTVSAVQPSRSPQTAPLQGRTEATRVSPTVNAELMRRLAQRVPDMKAQIEQAETSTRAEIDRLNREIDRLNAEISRLNTENSNLRSRLNAAGGDRRQLDEQRKRISQLEVQVQELQRRGTDRDEALKERDAAIKRLTAERGEKDRQISDLKRIIDQLKSQLVDRDRTIAQSRSTDVVQDRTARDLRSALDQGNAAIAQARSDIAERDGVIATQKQSIAQFEGTVAQQKGSIDAQATQIRTLGENVRQQRDATTRLTGELKAVRSERLPWWVSGATLAGGLLGGLGIARLRVPRGVKPQQAATGSPMPQIARVEGRFRGAAAAPALAADPSAPVLRIRTSLHPASAPTWSLGAEAP